MTIVSSPISSKNSSFSENSFQASLVDFFVLLKPGVMSLVVYTGLIGALLAPHHLHPFLLMVSVFCIALGSGAAGALNMWFDRDIDGLMTRTQKRPIPSKRIAPDDALAFGVLLSFASVFLMALAANFLAAGLLAISIAFYVFIYTMWLKRLTTQNIVIGGAAGAFPPMIGWAAVEGTLNLYPFLLFLIIFLWTPYHFWALALYKNDDYKRANLPMLPVLKGIKATKKQILLYTLLTIGCSLSLYFFSFLGEFYLFSCLVLSAFALYFALELYFKEDLKLALKLFKFSILHLFALFSAMLLDQSFKLFW
jgi:protoheme IX farnesyltransferase